jgi:hypothetical protein
MWFALLAIPAGVLLGLGVCAYLAYGDTKLGVHPNTMGGPKQRAKLLRSYMALGLLGAIGWITVTATTTNWLAFVLGLLGGLIGRAVFNRLDRRMTRYIG